MVGMSWRLVRGRGAAPLSFFVCAFLSVAIAILGKTQAPVVEGARAKLSDFASPALSETRAPLVAFERWTTGLATLFGVYAENIHLRQENAELQEVAERGSHPRGPRAALRVVAQRRTGSRGEAGHRPCDRRVRTVPSSAP